MDDPTALDWDSLGESELEAIEEALDRWELESRSGDSQDASAFCANADLIPYFLERVRELGQVAQFISSDTGKLSDEPPPSRIGAVQITGTVSRRIACDVFKGVQDNPRRTVAVKVLHHLGHDQSLAKGFLREIQTLAKLHHPGVAEVYFAGESTETGRRLLYFVMEYLEGPQLLTFVREQQFSIDQIVRLFVQVCDAIGHAHQRGVIHRDLKPSNVLTTGDGRPKILDFGIAKSFGPAGTAYSAIAGIGTPGYMSPEQFDEGKEQDTRSDIYSLGVILYELITNELPYRNPVRSIAQAAAAFADDGGVPIRQRRPECANDLAAIIRKCLRENPDQRYGNVQLLANDLRCYLDGKPVSARSLSYSEIALRFSRRHRVATWLGSITIACIIAAVITSLWFWNNAIKVAGELEETVGRMELARFHEIKAREDLESELVRSQRSSVNHSLSLAERNWQASPDLVGQWLNETRLDRATPMSFAWLVQKHRSNRVLEEYQAHRFEVVDVAVSMEQQRMVSASRAGVLSARDLGTGERLWRKEMGLHQLRCCDLDAETGGVVAIDEKELVLIDFESGRTIRRTKSALDYPTDIAFSPAHEFLLVQDDANRAAVWDAGLEELVRVFEAPFSSVLDWSIDVAANELAAVSEKGAVVRWDLLSGKVMSNQQLDAGMLHVADIGDDHRQIASAALYNKFHVHDLNRGAAADQVIHRRTRFDRLKFLSNQEWVITVSRGQVQGLRKSSGWNHHWLRHPEGKISCLEAAEEPGVYVLGFADGRIQICSVNAIPMSRELSGSLYRPRVLCPIENSDRLIVFGDDVASVDLVSLRVIAKWPAPKSRVIAASLRPDGQINLVAAKQPRLFRGRANESGWQVIREFDSPIQSMISQRSNGKLMIGVGEGAVALLSDSDDAELGDKMVKKLRVHPSAVTALAFHDESGLWASGSGHGGVAIWDERNRLIVKWREDGADEAQISKLAFTPDGSRLYAVSRDYSVYGYDLENEMATNPIRIAAERINAMAISPDSQTLALGGAGKKVILCDAVTGEFQATLSGHQDSIMDLKFIWGGAALLSISLDGTLRIWEPAIAGLPISIGESKQ